MKVKVTTPWKVDNQFVIHIGADRYFQSYESIICKIDKYGTTTLGTDWKYSVTTSKYRTLFLNGETTKETQQKLDSGEYSLDDTLHVGIKPTVKIKDKIVIIPENCESLDDLLAELSTLLKEM